MDIKEAVLYVGNLVYATGSKEDREAWQTLKSAVSEQTAHNTASTPLVHECDWRGESDYPDRE